MTLSVTHINLFSCLFADFILYNQRNWRITLVYRTTPLDYDTDSRAGCWNGFCRGFALLQARPCELTPLPRQLHPTWDKNFASKPFYSLNFSSRHFTQSHATPCYTCHFPLYRSVTIWKSQSKPDFAGIFAVPSENKRDLRSIEETLNDIRKRKKFRPGEADDEEDDVEAEDSG